MNNIRKMQTAAGGPIHYSRTMTTDNLSKAANYVGNYILKGLGAFGKIMAAPLTGGPLGPTTVVLPKTKKLLDAERKITETQELLIGKASTWLSPLNYGTALVTGNGLNARKGEEEVASWSPAWQAVGRLGELYVGPKGAKGVIKATKAGVETAVNTAAKAGSKSAKKAVIVRELRKNTKDTKLDTPNRYVTRSYSFNDDGNISSVGYQLIDPITGQPLGNAVFSSPYSGAQGRIVGWIESQNRAHGVSEDLYNIGVQDAKLVGLPGLESGWDLMEPLKTLNVTKKFPHKVIGESEGHPVRLLTGTTSKQQPTSINLSNHYIYLLNNIRYNSNTGNFEEVKPVIDENKLSLKFFERKPFNSKLTPGEEAGVPKVDRNFTPRWHVANYPGYLLKGLMKGSQLEKQLSKNGTININLLNAYFNKVSQIEKKVANKVLTEKFAGLKTIDYNLFKKAVLDELITYNRKPQTKYEDYGANKLGYPKKILGSDATVGDIEAQYPGRFLTTVRPLFRMVDTKTGRVVTNNAELQLLVEALNNEGIRYNTFTFESPRILVGSDKHYDFETLGHSRTYTIPEEPKILYVMESLSDWAQEGIAKTNEAYRQRLINNPESYNKRINSLLRMNEELEDWENMVRTGINHEGIKLQPYEIQQIQQEFIPRLRENILNFKIQLEGNPQALHLSNNYLLRQLQENLRYAAENGLTKMRYPTSETAAKIEGYLKTINPKYLELLHKLSELQMRLNELLNLEALSKMFNEPFSVKDNLAETYKVREELNSILDLILQIRSNGIEKTYVPEHQTILKKYADFPKLFLKLFKDLQVRTVIDAKGNTWYEVDVPKGYLNKEWLFKDGGLLYKFKNGLK